MNLKQLRAVDVLRVENQQGMIEEHHLPDILAMVGLVFGKRLDLFDGIAAFAHGHGKTGAQNRRGKQTSLTLSPAPYIINVVPDG